MSYCLTSEQTYFEVHDLPETLCYRPAHYGPPLESGDQPVSQHNRSKRSFAKRSSIIPPVPSLDCLASNKAGRRLNFFLSNLRVACTSNRHRDGTVPGMALAIRLTPAALVALVESKILPHFDTNARGRPDDVPWPTDCFNNLRNLIAEIWMTIRYIFAIYRDLELLHHRSHS